MSVRHLLDEQAERVAHRPFVEDARSERVLDYASLRAAAADWAAALDATGIPAGARVLLDVADPLAFAAAHLGVIAAGRCSAPVDPAAPAAEVARTRRALGPTLVVTDRVDLADRTDSAGRFGGLPVLRARRDTGGPSAAPPGWIGRPGQVARPAAGSGAAALLTSGSTGPPKTVVLDQHQLLHVARSVARHHRLTSADRGYNPLPLFHINAEVVGLLATLVSGGTLVADRRFSRRGFWELLVAREVSWVNAVPAILAILARTDVSIVPPRLRFIRSASAALPIAVRELMTARTGVPIVESYGMTEAGSQITATPLDGPYRPGSVGVPVGVGLRVLDRDGSAAPPGQVGRVVIRGAGVIRRYAEDVCAERFDADGWLDTGDLGRLDADGHLSLVGRADDVINRGGELIYPREVEEVLMADAGVAEVAVVGRPDGILGAVPVARVRPIAPALAQPDMAEDAADSAAHGGADELRARLGRRCEQQLSAVKRPVQILLVAELPTGPTGKVSRRRVRDQLEREIGIR